MRTGTAEAIPATTVTVDMAVFTVADGEFKVLLIRRGKPPFEGAWALPGGFLESTEDLDAAARRELVEETALTSDRVHLEQCGVYSAPDRDPRTRVVTVSYLALVPSPPTAVAGGDAAGVRWHAVSWVAANREALAFDHDRIVLDAADKARAKLEHTTVAAAFCPPEFTISQLREVYEIVWDERLDQGNFHRKIGKVPDFLVPTGTSTTRGGRPAALYRAGSAARLRPPLYRGTLALTSGGQESRDGGSGVGSRNTKLICGNRCRNRRSALSLSSSMDAPLAVSAKSTFAATKIWLGPRWMVYSSRTCLIVGTASSSSVMRSRIRGGTDCPIKSDLLAAASTTATTSSSTPMTMDATPS